MFYGCETNPMNQPIEEKWKESLNSLLFKNLDLESRNANPDTLTATIIAREGEERLRLVRNALIDELIEEVDRIELCRHDMVRIFVLLESKKK